MSDDYLPKKHYHSTYQTHPQLGHYLLQRNVNHHGHRPQSAVSNSFLGSNPISRQVYRAEFDDRNREISSAHNLRDHIQNIMINFNRKLLPRQKSQDVLNQNVIYKDDDHPFGITNQEKYEHNHEYANNNSHQRGEKRGQKQCNKGYMANMLGKCVKPHVRRDVYFFSQPAVPPIRYSKHELPEPKVNLNYVFLHTAGSVQRPQPLVAPAAKQRTLIFLLNKQSDLITQDILDVPSALDEPAVFFVNYKEGDNLQLPGGLDLETVLSEDSKSNTDHQFTVSQFHSNFFDSYNVQKRSENIPNLSIFVAKLIEGDVPTSGQDSNAIPEVDDVKETSVIKIS